RHRCAWCLVHLTTQLATEERRQRDLFHGGWWRLCSCQRTASGAYRTRPEAWLCSRNECIRGNYECPRRIREPFVQSKRRHAREGVADSSRIRLRPPQLFAHELRRVS